MTEPFRRRKKAVTEPFRREGERVTELLISNELLYEVLKLSLGDREFAGVTEGDGTLAWFECCS